VATLREAPGDMMMPVIDATNLWRLIMRKLCILALLVAVGACVAAARAADTPATYTDPQNGFSLQAPDLGISKVTTTPVIFSGSVEDGFAANVTVRITPGAAVMKDFLPENLAQLKTMNAKVLSQKTMTVSGREAVLLEFSATINGKALHFLSLSVLARGRRLRRITRPTRRRSSNALRVFRCRNRRG
jgi:hypothetical protein